jgi:transposase
VGPGDNGPRLEGEVRFIGIDVGSQSHLVAIVDEVVQVLLKPTSFAEDAAGYDKLRKLLGEATDCLVAMEATGHYGKNLLLTLVAWGFPVAVLNPLRTRRFAEEDLTRAKTDAVDALASIPTQSHGLTAANHRCSASLGTVLRCVSSP